MNRLAIRCLLASILAASAAQNSAAVFAPLSARHQWSGSWLQLPGLLHFLPWRRDDPRVESLPPQSQRHDAAAKHAGLRGLERSGGGVGGAKGAGGLVGGGGGLQKMCE